MVPCEQHRLAEYRGDLSPESRSALQHSKKPIPHQLSASRAVLSGSTPDAWTSEIHAHTCTPHYTLANSAGIKQDTLHAAALL